MTTSITNHIWEAVLNDSVISMKIVHNSSLPAKDEYLVKADGFGVFLCGGKTSINAAMDHYRTVKERVKHLSADRLEYIINGAIYLTLAGAKLFANGSKCEYAKQHRADVISSLEAKISELRIDHVSEACGSDDASGITDRAGGNANNVEHDDVEEHDAAFPIDKMVDLDIKKHNVYRESRMDLEKILPLIQTKNELELIHVKNLNKEQLHLEDEQLIREAKRVKLALMIDPVYRAEQREIAERQRNDDAKRKAKEEDDNNAKKAIKQESARRAAATRKQNAAVALRAKISKEYKGATTDSERHELEPSLDLALRFFFPDAEKRLDYIVSMSCAAAAASISTLTMANGREVGAYTIKVDGLAFKYYVGKSTNIGARIESHINHTAAECTKLNTGVKRLKLSMAGTGNCLDAWERAETLSMMYMHGIGNVRGWIYNTTVLSPADKANAFINICAWKDLCNCCGNKGHFATNCQGTAMAAWTLR